MLMLLHSHHHFLDRSKAFDYHHPMLKVSFSGIPGSGRSSLVAEVRKILALKSKIDVTEEISRKNPFDDRHRSSFQSQFFFLSTQINEENKRSFTALDYLLCDQSVLDQWISWRYMFEQHKDNKSTLWLERNQILQNLFRFWIKTYDLTFFIRVSGDIHQQRKAENQLRQVNGLDQETREQIFLKTIQEEKLTVTEIWNNTSVDEAAHKIIQVIQDCQGALNSKHQKKAVNLE